MEHTTTPGGEMPNVYEDADGNVRQAPEDCVRVEPFVVASTPPPNCD